MNLNQVGDLTLIFFVVVFVFCHEVNNTNWSKAVGDRIRDSLEIFSEKKNK